MKAFLMFRDTDVDNDAKGAMNEAELVSAVMTGLEISTPNKDQVPELK